MIPVHLMYENSRKLTPSHGTGVGIYLYELQVSSQVQDSSVPCAANDTHPGSWDQGLHHLQVLKP